MKPIRTVIAAIAAVILVSWLFGTPSSAQPNPVPPVTPGSATAAGSATAESGSGEAAGSATAAAAGSAAGSGAGSGSAAAQPKIEEVDCAKTPPELTVKLVASKYEITPAATPLTTGSVVEFQLPASDDAVNDAPKDPKANVGLLHANAGATTCFRYNADGEYPFHSEQHPSLGASIYARAWYDIIADKPIEDPDGGNFWLPKAVNKAADDSDMMFYAVLALSVVLLLRDRRRRRLLRRSSTATARATSPSRRRRTTTRSRSRGR